MPRSTASTATPIGATQRRLIVGIVIVTLLAWAIVIAGLAIGGRPDPPTLRATATLLDGSWRFHIGDDRHWAIGAAAYRPHYSAASGRCLHGDRA